MFRKFIALILAAAIFIVPCSAFADTELTEKRIGRGVIPSSIDRSHLKDKHYRIGPSKSKDASKASAAQLLTAASTLPSSYIIEGLPEVRNQGSLNNCWTFSGMAAVESHLLTNYDISEIDLSEWHTTYFAYNNESDELYSFSPIYSDTLYYDQGGNADIFIALLARGTGALYDAKAPTISSGSNAYTVPSIPKDITLLNAYYVGDIGGLGASGADWDKIAIVKEALYNYGAITISIYHDDLYLDSSSNGYYTGGATTSVNHAVTIVGWDDTFTSNEFGTDVDQPPIDGAWIVMNNYGTSWGENGFYYVSYAETSAKDGYIMEAEIADPKEKIYQHDPLGPAGYIGLTSNPTSLTFANIFTAEEDGSLVKVATFTNDSELLCDIQVYVGVEEGNPASGWQALSMEGIELSAPGYHTIELSDEIVLSAEDKFSVIATLYKEDNSTITKQIPAMYESSSGLYQNVVINEGNSFIRYTSGGWHDLALSDTPRAVCLKAIVINDEDPLTITPDTASIAVGDNVQLSASKGGVTWNTDSTAASVDANGLVTGLSSGKAYVRAETDTRYNYAFISVGTGSGGNTSVDTSYDDTSYDSSSGGSGCNTGGYGALSLLFALPFMGFLTKKNKK